MTEIASNTDSSFSLEFCEKLEFHLTRTFKNAEDKELKAFWCDGIDPTGVDDLQTTRKSVNDTRKLVTKAWLGKDGQDVYEMTLLLGPKGLSNYAKGKSLLDCLPSDDTFDWINLDTVSRTIELKLK